ncbi:helix-turn-helix domain-containing protein [Timonella sp. A28]|uniref:helix-turn-helix domain-containing protein n=1 Tax=Timonella sp. A28 TaxID=3442640 RepID=UPI003EBE7793
MGTFTEYKKKRPANPEAVAAYKQEALEEIRAYRLQELRKELGLTQTDLAEEIGVSQVRISALERGRVEDVVVKTLQQYAHALGGKLRVEIELGDTTFKLT